MRYYRRIIWLVGLLIVAILVCLMLLLPTRDYMKMSFSEKIYSGHGAHIVVNGDSIGGTVGQGEWCSLLKEKIESKSNKSIEITNISKPGNNSFAGIVSWEMLDYTEKALSDLVILCYGQNDVDDETFAINYEALIRNTIKRNPNAEIIAILESSQRDYTNKINTILELCDYYRIPYVDTIKAFKESGYSYEELSDDGIHPNAKGKEIYADAIYKVIQSELLTKKHILDFKGERPANKKAKNPETIEYTNFKYFSADTLDVDQNTISLEVPKSSMIGLDIEFVKGEHGIVLTSDIDEEKHYVGYIWDNENSQRHIYMIYNAEDEATKFKFVFSEKNDIQNLYGVACFY